MSDLLAPRRDTKIQRKTHLTRTQQQLWGMIRYGAGDAVVAGVGIAHGSRAKYDVDS